VTFLKSTADKRTRKLLFARWTISNSTRSRLLWTS